MNREIDINKFNKSITFQNRGIGFTQLGIAKEILDLIDDLQQENKQLKENWATRTKSYNKVVLKNADLQQENKQLKEELEYLRSNEYLNQVKWERNFNEEIVKDLQQRIDKTIDLTKNFLETEDRGYYQIIFKEILKSLGDKENE